MRAAIVNEFGPIASHTVGDLPDPVPHAGELLVTIKATAVNFVDSLVVTGKYQFLPQRPFAPGKMPVGKVTALGANVTGFKIGDRVLTMAEQGGYAQKVAVEAKQCFKLPASMSFGEAASMALVYDTSWFALRERARIQPGDSVLVLGATGGVGFASVQLAKAMGATVLAGVSSAAKAAAVLAAGASDFIDLSQPDLCDSLREQVFTKNDGKGVDIVIDPVGGDAFDAALRALAWRGRLVVIGFASGRIPEVKANYLLVKNIEVTGLQVSDYRKRMPEMMSECMREIFTLYEHGKLKPAPFQSRPLDAFSTSLQEIVDRRASGRIVLEPNP
ncbi:MAG TPA: NADPH:quinone oxidoreductase family protein [Xanthobacteraceae bacterium]|jgi:NADPH2:quinone reductase|nr:NADPH:quinone oxidoreductase family protein [Xanthobacteraceae bacterium]